MSIESPPADHDTHPLIRRDQNLAERLWTCSEAPLIPVFSTDTDPRINSAKRFTLRFTRIWCQTRAKKDLPYGRHNFTLHGGIYVAD